MGVRDFLDSIEVLRSRLDLFTAGVPYELEVLADSAILLLPEQCLGEKEVSDILRQYLTRPVKLYLVDVATAGGFGMELQKLELDREDLEQLRWQYGAIEGFAVHDVQKNKGGKYVAYFLKLCHNHTERQE